MAPEQSHHHKGFYSFVGRIHRRRPSSVHPATAERARRWWPRSRLARDITIILVIKLVALITIKVMWFSDPPVTPRTEVVRMLLGPTDQDAP